MTPQEFQRLKRGLDEKYGAPPKPSADSGATLDDFDRLVQQRRQAKQGQGAAAAPTGENPGLLSRIGSDVKERATEAYDTFGEAARGEITPVETGIRVVGQAAGAVGDVVSEGVKSAYDTLVPDFVKKAGKSVIKSALGGDAGVEQAKNLIAKPINAYQDFAEKNPRVAKTVEGVANIASLLPVEKGISVAARTAGPLAMEATEAVGKTVAKRAVQTLDADVERAIVKAVRPPVSTAGSAAQSKAYLDRAKKAVNAIIENEPNLSIVDDAGEAVATPQSLKQFSEAIDQTKKEVFKKYSAKATEAGEAGAIVKLDKAANELATMADNVVLQDKDPGLISYIQQKSDLLRKRSAYTPEQAQEAIKLYNDSLEAFYRNPSYDTASKAAVDAVVANNLRSNLDEAIEGMVGPGYQELKNTYGALKTIEKDVAKRAMVDARKNVKGLLDFSDIFSGSEAVRAIVGMNPAALASSAAVKGISELYKRLNDPNAIIKGMFKAAKKAKDRAAKYGLTSEESAFIPKPEVK